MRAAGRRVGDGRGRWIEHGHAGCRRRPAGPRCLRGGRNGPAAGRLGRAGAPDAAAAPLSRPDAGRADLHRAGPGRPRPGRPRARHALRRRRADALHRPADADARAALGGAARAVVRRPRLRGIAGLAHGRGRAGVAPGVGPGGLGGRRRDGGPAWELRGSGLLRLCRKRRHPAGLRRSGRSRRPGVARGTAARPRLGVAGRRRGAPPAHGPAGARHGGDPARARRPALAVSGRRRRAGARGGRRMQAAAVRPPRRDGRRLARHPARAQHQPVPDPVARRRVQPHGMPMRRRDRGGPAVAPARPGPAFGAVRPWGWRASPRRRSSAIGCRSCWSCRFSRGGRLGSSPCWAMRGWPWRRSRFGAATGLGASPWRCWRSPGCARARPFRRRHSPPRRSPCHCSSAPAGRCGRAPS